MATVLCCHLVETIWSKRDAGLLAPYVVLDHNGVQHETEPQQAGAVTVWNTKATFTYAPHSELNIMAFDAGKGGAFVAQAVVDVASTLQGKRVNASAPLLNRRGHSLGLVLYDLELVTSSRSLAAGLNIPALTLCHVSNPDSPRSKLERAASEDGDEATAAEAAAATAAGGRHSPFAMPEAQLQRQQASADGVVPSTPPSVRQRLAHTFSQALGAARRGGHSPDCGSSAALAAGGGRGLRASREQAAVPGSPTTNRSGALRARSRMLQVSPSIADRASAPPSPAATAGGACPAAAAAAVGSFASWGTGAARASVDSLLAPVPAAAGMPVGRSWDGPARGSRGSASRVLEAQRPQQLAIPREGISAASSPAQSPGGRGGAPPAGEGELSGLNLSPLTGNRPRLRLQRRAPHAPPPPPPCVQPQGSGLIPVGTEPGSPDSVAIAAGGLLLQQHLQEHLEAHQRQLRQHLARHQHQQQLLHQQQQQQQAAGSADFSAQLLREYAAADAAGKEAILYRELLGQRAGGHRAGPTSAQLLSMLVGQEEPDRQQQQQRMLDALDALDNASPVTHASASRAAAALDFLPARLSSAAGSSRRCSSGSGGNDEGGVGGSARGGGGTRSQHDPSLPASLLRQQQQQQQLDEEFLLADTPAASAALAAADSCGSGRYPAVPAALMTAAAVVESIPVPDSPQWLHASVEACAGVALSDDEGSRVRQVKGRLVQQQRRQRQHLRRKYPEPVPSPAAAAAAAARLLNAQLLQRLQEQEAAEVAEGLAQAEQLAESDSSSSAHSESESDAEQQPLDARALSPLTTRAGALAGVARAAAARRAGGAHTPQAAPVKERRPAAAPAAAAAASEAGSMASSARMGAIRAPPSPLVQPAYTSSKGSSSYVRTAHGRASASGITAVRFVPPVQDVLPYPHPLPAFPAVAVCVDPTAPCLGPDAGAAAGAAAAGSSSSWGGMSSVPSGSAVC